MQHNVQQLIELLNDLVVSVSNTDASFQSVSSVEEYQHDSVIFLSSQFEHQGIFQNPPAVIVTDAQTAATLQAINASVVVVQDVRLALALSKQRFADYDPRDSEWADIHPSAVIHETAKLADGVRIGPNTVVGRDVEIGEGVQIRANCVIEHDAVIGRDTIIHNMVNIGYASVIGERVIIRPGVIIGNEGFGFAQDGDKRYHRIPHTGIVVIGDDVHIGSNSNIDRGTYGVTQIARGVKIDALCHIAHNVMVDEDALFVAQCGVAGSSNIGKRAILSGQTGVLDHRTIADDAILVHRCGVTTDVPHAGMWAGTPPKPFKEYVRDINLSKKVDKLEKRIRSSQIT